VVPLMVFEAEKYGIWSVVPVPPPDAAMVMEPAPGVMVTPVPAVRLAATGALPVEPISNCPFVRAVLLNAPAALLVTTPAVVRPVSVRDEPLSAVNVPAAAVVAPIAGGAAKADST